MFPLVYFVRHGQTDWNRDFRFQGQNEVDLNDAGRAQADRNGAKLAELIEDPEKFDFVASPMRRTVETMERLRVAMGLPPTGYRTDRRLIEVNFGDWTGRTSDELKADDPEFRRHRRQDKWNIRSVRRRARRATPCSWRDSSRGSTDLEKPTVCVTHGGNIRAGLSWSRSSRTIRRQTWPCRRTKSCGSRMAVWTGSRESYSGSCMSVTRFSPLTWS